MNEEKKSKKQSSGESAEALEKVAQLSAVISTQNPEEIPPPEEHRFSKALPLVPLAMMISRITDDTIIDINKQFQNLLGYSRAEVVGRTTTELGLLVNPDDRERAGRILREGGAVGDFESKLRKKSGEICHTLMSVESIDVDGEPCFLRMAYDITVRKQTEEKLLAEANSRAFIDPLTGLPNRALFMDRLGRAVVRAKRRTDYFFAVLFLDLDRLKLINDRLGHLAGDQLLLETAQRLQRCIRLGDTVGRMGGDEFAILLDDIVNVSDALRVAERLQTDFVTPFILGGEQISVTISVGIVFSASGYALPEELLRDADQAMYRAKQQGGARHHIFDPELRSDATARLKLETDLLWAVKHRGFEVHYQPIVSLATGKITAFEALGRWQHPHRGLVSLLEFIPVAEETGLIVEIGRWILKEACAKIRDWQEIHPFIPKLGINVNLSPREFNQPDLVEQIESILKETELDASCLSLEVTEGVMMAESDANAEVFAHLRDLGVRLLIDDFGEGHSSLNLMYRHPIDGLKITRSFVSKLGTGGSASEIVRTIVMLARDNGLDVTAKGIETQDQVAQLRALNCPTGQGFYFSKPMRDQAALELLARNKTWGDG